MRKSPSKLLFIAMAMALLAAACGGADESPESVSTSESGSPSASETELPKQYFTAPAVDGGQIDLGESFGKDVVLWFWAPW